MQGRKTGKELKEMITLGNTFISSLALPRLFTCANFRLQCSFMDEQEAIHTKLIQGKTTGACKENYIAKYVPD
jgi:hypothetical protein